MAMVDFVWRFDEPEPHGAAQASGGSGSGRRQRYQRRTTEGYLALDIAVLRRRGLLAAWTFEPDFLVARRSRGLARRACLLSPEAFACPIRQPRRKVQPRGSMSGLRFGRHRHRSVDNDNGSDVQAAIANAASCMAGLASAAGCAMGSGTRANSKAAPSAPTGVPARSGGGSAAPTA